MKKLKVLSPTAILGYGFPEKSFQDAMAMQPDVIAVDAGSTDPGPYYLGAGKSFTDRNAVKRDLSYMLPAAVEAGIPLIIGSAGGCGGKSHLDWNVDIITELAREMELDFKLAVIDAEIGKEVVLKKLEQGEISPLFPAPMCNKQDVQDAVRIVGQMGIEPFLKALEQGATVIVAGRAYDPSVFACYPISQGYQAGLSIHMGKILECAAIAATPGSGSDCMMGIIGEDYFTLMPLNPIRKCTVLSVSAHTLYEKSNPTKLPGPGGTLDLTQTTFEQISDNAVMVRGSQLVASENYTIKLEGAKLAGYRTVSIAACRDPIMIAQIDTIIKEVKARVQNNFENYGMKEFFLDFKVYGKNGVMALFDDLPKLDSKELCIVIEAVASTQEESNTICSFARSTMLHFGYEGRKSTAGNLAFPFSPSDFSAGAVYEFNLYHLMNVSDPCEPFDIQVMDCTKGALS